MKKELYIFVGIFLFLTIGMHFDQWVSHPIVHLKALPHAGAYGIGAWHPLVFTIAGYIILGFFRVIFALFSKIFAPKKS